MLSMPSVQLTEMLSYSGQAPVGLTGPQLANSTTLPAFSDLMRGAPGTVELQQPVISGETLPRDGNALPLLPAMGLSLDEPPLTFESSEVADIGLVPLAPGPQLPNAPTGEAAPADNAKLVPAAMQPMDVQGQMLTSVNSAAPSTGRNDMGNIVVTSATVADGLPKQPAPVAPLLVASRAELHSALQYDADYFATQVPEQISSRGGFGANMARSTAETMPGDPDADTAIKTRVEAATLPAASTAQVAGVAATSASALPPLLSVPVGPSAVTTPVAAPLHFTGGDLAVGGQNWADAFSDRVLMIAGKQIQRAEIRLHPAELGSVQIRISVEDNATSLSFTAQNAIARDAIEQALPRLRDLFTDSGLTLDNATVSENGARQHDGEQSLAPTIAAEADARTESDADDAGQDTLARRSLRSANQLIDTFA